MNNGDVLLPVEASSCMPMSFSRAGEEEHEEEEGGEGEEAEAEAVVLFVRL